MNLLDFRRQYPQYDDISDEELANSLYTKFYSDLPKEEFLGRILPPKVTQEYAAPQMPEEQMAVAEVIQGRAEIPTARPVRPEPVIPEYQPPVTPEEQMAEATLERSVTEALPKGAPVSGRPLEMPRLRTFDERTPSLIGLGAAAERAIAAPAPAPTRPGPTLEAARQLEQQRIIQLAQENAGDIESARKEVSRLYEEYPDLSQPKEQDILTYSALSSGARFIANMGDALYMAAEAGEKNIVNPDLVDAVKPGIVTSLQNLAANLFPRDEEGKIKRLELSERFEKKAKELAPSILNKPFDEAWDKDQALTWVAAKVANSADSAGLLAATVLVPKLAPVTMPIFYASAAGGTYAEDRAAGRSVEQATLAAQIAGTAEVAFESLDVLMFRGAGKALGSLTKSMSAAEKEAFAASLVGRAIKGMAVTSAASLGSGLSESATSIVQDLSKKYVSERDPGDMGRNAKESFIVGLAMGPLFSAIGAAPRIVERVEEIGAERAAEQARTAALQRWQTEGLVQPAAPAAPIAAQAPVAPPAAPVRTIEQVREQVLAAPDTDSAIAEFERGVSEVPTRAQIAAAAEPIPAAPQQLERPVTEDQLLTQIQGVVAGEPVTPAITPVTPEVIEAKARIEAPPTGRVEVPRIEVPPTGRVEAPVAAPEAPAEVPRISVPPTGRIEAPAALPTGRVEAAPRIEAPPTGRAEIPAAAPRIEAPPTGRVEPVAPVTPAAPEAPKFTDLTAAKANKAQGIAKGEVLTFKSEKQAAAYVKSNKVRGFTPRQTEDGWVLSKPVRERTQAQIAAARQRMQVREDDDLLTALAKMGGINATNLERDGADGEDLKSVNKGSVLKPFRRTGGMSVDGAAEAMAEMGYDVYDENGNIDAGRARSLIDEAIGGTKVYTPNGYMIVESRNAEERDRFEAAKEQEALEIVNAMPAMAEDELLTAAAAPREIAPEVPVTAEIPAGAVRLEEPVPGEFVVATPVVQQENLDQAFAQAETQVRQGSTAQYENAEPTYEPTGPSDQSAARVSEPSPEYAVRRRGGLVQLRAGGFYQTLGEQGHLGLVGQRVDSPAKLAELAQIYRNPGYETFRVFFTDQDGRIVEQTGASARLPGQANFIGVTDGTQIFSDWIQSRMEKNNAEGFYILHNHPSGDPTPSQQDADATRAIADNGFLGHIVINGNRYAKIDANGEYELLPLQTFSTQDPVRRQLMQNGVIGTPIAADADVAKIGRLFTTSEDMSVVMAQGNTGVTAIGEIPNQTLLDPQRGPAAIRRFARFNGGAQIFVYTQQANRINPNVVRLYDQGFVTDVVSGNGNSIVAERGFSPNQGTFGGTRTRPIRQLGEERAIQEPSAEAVSVLPRARGGEAVGERDAQREEAAREGRPREAGAEEVAFREADYRPSVVNWAKKEFGDRVAPNGNPVWENFVRWFGDSQVVNEKGAPLVVYHGTASQFDRFTIESQGKTFFEYEGAFPRSGFWFTTDPAEADWYSAVAARNKGGEGRQTISVYLSLKNPYVVSAEDFASEGEYVVPEYGDPRLDGYDGIIVPIADYNKDGEIVVSRTHYVAFSSEQIKSSVGNNGNFSTEPSIVAQPLPPYSAQLSRWFSELERQVSQGPESMPAAQWKGWLANRKSIKPDEIFWTGINDFLDLQTGKISKQQIQDFLKENGVRVAETELDTVDAPFQQYTLPGGENYRVVLLTLPVEKVSLFSIKPDGNIYRVYDSAGELVQSFRTYEEADRYRKYRGGDGVPFGPKTYRSPHFGQLNIIVHIRVNDRTDADGKRVLFVEEIQSDWGQEGKKKGFVQPPSESLPEGTEVFPPGTRPDLLNPDAKVWTVQLPRSVFGRSLFYGDSREEVEANAREFIAQKSLSAVPQAPFVTKTEGWLNLALKKIMVMAAEGGYDRVAFINGEQSVDRYDLSQQIRQIRGMALPDGRLQVEVDLVGGYEGPSFIVNSEEELADRIGKELAERLLNAYSEGGNDDGSERQVSISGDGLKVGGEGMKAFYDQIVPAAVKKLLPKVGGGQMATVDVSVEKPITQAEVDAAERRRDFDEAERLTRIMERQQLGRGTDEAGAKTTIQQTGFDVTPKMREFVGGGMPLFQPLTPYTAGGNSVTYNVNDPTRADAVIRTMQDRAIDLKRVIDNVRKAGVAVKEAFNPYLQEGLYASRVAAKDDSFRDTEWLPLLKDIGQRGLTREEVEQYLHARHAPSRNREMAKRNPTRDELNAKIQEIRDAVRNATPGSMEAESLNRELRAWEAIEPFRGTEEERNSLSGMSTQAATDYMNSLSPEKKANLEAVAAKVDAIIAKTRKMLIDGGVDSNDSFNDNFEYYVPLYREGLEEAGGGYGQGFSVRGKTTKAATGSLRGVVDILASVAAARALAVTRVEKNRIANAMLGLALTAKDPSLWQVDVVPKVPTLDKATGKVVMRGNPNYGAKDNVIIARVPDGKGGIVERAVVFNEGNERAMLIARFMKNLDADTLGGFETRLASVTRFIASMNTQYNPIFGIVNLLRDIQGAAVNLSDTPLAGKQVELVKTSTKMFSEIALELRAQRRGETRDTEYSRLFEEFKAEGGQTGFRSTWGTREEATREIEKAIKRVGAKGAAGAFYKTSDALASVTKHALSDWNQTLENTIRLAAYKMAKDSGMSKAEAAMLAKDITVNFNRKGTISTKMGAYYAFFNASVQGTARLGRVLDVKFSEKGYPTIGPRGLKIIAGGVSIGMLQAFMLAAAGFDEDEPPEFVKEKNFIIPLAFFDKFIDVNKLGLDPQAIKNKYITIPMPLGLNILPNLGRLSTELVLNDFKDPGKKAANMIRVAVDSFNPLGSATFAQTIAPTTLDPFVALYENRDWTGKPIYRESLDKFESKPGFERAKDNASFFGLMVSKGLNRLSGGTDYTSGAFPSVLSPTPDQIDYLVGQALGGVGRELTKFQKTISAQVTGEELPPYQIPLVSRFYGEIRNKAAEGQKFYDNVKELLKHQREVEGMAEEIRRREEAGQDAEKIRDDLDAYIEKNPQYELAPAARSIMRQVQQIRARKREAIKEGAERDEVKEFEDAITERMMEFNSVVKEFGK